MRTFADLIHRQLDTIEDGWRIPPACYEKMTYPPLREEAGTVAGFWAHPDDESLGAHLPILLRRDGARVLSVGVTVGSDPKESTRRILELYDACIYFGFQMCLLDPDGFSFAKGNDSRAHPQWTRMVEKVALFLKTQQPRIVITHHTDDDHYAHRGTSLLVRDAIGSARWNGLLFETEYWSHMRNPNMIVEVGAEDLVHILEGLSFHKGELERNPYHLFEPSRLRDSVRRAEIVLGRGTKPPAYAFASLYRRSICTAGGIVPVQEKIAVGAQDPISALIAV